MVGTEQQNCELLCVDCLWSRVAGRAAWVAGITGGADCGLCLGVPMSGCTFWAFSSTLHSIQEIRIINGSQWCASAKKYCLPTCSFVAPPLKPSKGSGELRVCFAYNLVQPKCDFNPWEIWNIKNYWAILHVTYFSSQNINSPKERSLLRKL